ncbi:MAG TPA: translation initiation factor IF-3 [Chloroflexia bacterium]|nr:translation initiation factor IF-3 [Chloroflexia bacterium]
MNERIRAREVRLIGEDGENSLMFVRDALALARQRGMDLVEVAPNEVPPVVKMMDYGRFRYEQTKKERDARKTQKQVVIKEVRLSPKIDDHDIDTKARMARRFLEDGDKVKLTVRFRGRELAHPEIGRDVLEQVRQMLGENIVIELAPKMDGKAMTMVVSAKPGKPAPKPRPAAPPTQAQGPAAGPSPAPNGSTPPAPTAPVAPAAPAEEPVAVGATGATGNTQA